MNDLAEARQWQEFPRDKIELACGWSLVEWYERVWNPELESSEPILANPSYELPERLPSVHSTAAECDIRQESYDANEFSLSSANVAGLRGDIGLPR